MADVSNKPTKYAKRRLNREGANGGRELLPAAKPPQPHYEVDPVTGCWNWTRSVGPHGYGQTRYNGQHTGAHRAYYAHFVGPIPAKKLVMHACDNRRCVNPKHLLLGTHADNMHDGATKGRINRGEANKGGGKLTEAQALLARDAYLAGVNRDVIATALGIHPYTVWEIARGRKWKHLGDAA